MTDKEIPDPPRKDKYFNKGFDDCMEGESMQMSSNQRGLVRYRSGFYEALIYMDEHNIMPKC